MDKPETIIDSELTVRFVASSKASRHIASLNLEVEEVGAADVSEIDEASEVEGANQ